MPVVPIEQQQISLNVPGVSGPGSSSFGQVGKALEGVGTSVENTGLQILTQVKTAEANNDASNAYSQYKIDANQKMMALKLQSPDGYLRENPQDPNSAYILNDPNDPSSRRSISDEFRDWSNERYQNDQQNMGTELAANMYRERALPYMTDQITAAQNDTQIMQVKKFDSDQVLRVKSKGDSYGIDTFLSAKQAYDPATGKAKFDPITHQPVYESTFNTQKLYSDVADLAQEGAANIGTMHNATENQAKQAELQKQLSMDYLRTVYADLKQDKKTGQDRTSLIQDVTAARDLIRGTDAQSVARRRAGLPVLSDMMDPAQREVELAKIESMIPQAKAQDFENYKKTFDEAKTALSSGLSRNPEALLQSMLSQTYSYGSADVNHQADAASRGSQIVGAYWSGKVNSPEFRNMSDTQQQHFIDGIGPKAQQMGQKFGTMFGLNNSEVFGAAAATEAKASLITTAKKARDAKAADSASFAMQPNMDDSGRSQLPTGARVAMIDHTNLINIAGSGNAQAYQSFSKQYDTYAKTQWADHPDQIRAPITKQQSADVGNKLTQTDGPGAYNPSQKAQAVSSLARYWGKDFARNVDQMIQDKSLPDTYRLMELHAHDSPQAQAYLMSNLGGGDAADRVFRDQLGPTVTVGAERDMKDAVSDKLRAYAGTIIKSDPDGNQKDQLVADLNKVITNGAFHEMNAGVKDPKEAAQTAFNKLIGNFTTTHSTKPGGISGWFHSGPSTDISLPNSYEGRPLGPEQKQTIIENLNEDVKKYVNGNVAIPRVSPGQTPLTQEQFNSIVQRTAVPVTVRQPELGHIIKYVDDKGYPQVLMRLNSAGKPVPIFMPLHDQVNVRATNSPSMLDVLKKFQPDFSGSKQ